jgi:hypothetical protein
MNIIKKSLRLLLICKIFLCLLLTVEEKIMMCVPGLYKSHDYPIIIGFTFPVDSRMPFF